MPDCPSCARERARTRRLRKLLNLVMLRLAIITGRDVLAGGQRG